jgi:hypothetical protein
MTSEEMGDLAKKASDLIKDGTTTMAEALMVASMVQQSTTILVATLYLKKDK